MLERLDAAFATQRRFVADASHELRTPLTVMRTAIDVTLAKQPRTGEQLADESSFITGQVIYNTGGQHGPIGRAR